MIVVIVIVISDFSIFGPIYVHSKWKALKLVSPPYYGYDSLLHLLSSHPLNTSPGL